MAGAAVACPFGLPLLDAGAHADARGSEASAAAPTFPETPQAAPLTPAAGSGQSPGPTGPVSLRPVRFHTPPRPRSSPRSEASRTPPPTSSSLTLGLARALSCSFLSQRALRCGPCAPSTRPEAARRSAQPGAPTPFRVIPTLLSRLQDLHSTAALLFCKIFSSHIFK